MCGNDGGGGHSRVVTDGERQHAFYYINMRIQCTLQTIF